MKTLLLLLTAIASYPAAFAAAPVNPASPVNQFVDNSDMGCIDAKYAAQLIQKYGVRMSSFPGGLELCDSTKPSKMMLDSLVLIDRGQIGPTKRKGFDHQFMAPDYVKYFLGHIHSVVYDNECGNDNFMACVINQEPVMHVEKALFDNETLATQVATLIHEARHVDGFTHVTCEAGPNAGQAGTCDQSFDEGGSYAVEVEYEARMALNGVNFNPMFKDFARVAAIDRVEQNFVEKPSTAVPFLLLQDKADGHFADLAADGKTLVEHANAVAPVGTLLVDRADGANVVPADRSPNPLYLDYYTLGLSPQAEVSGLVGSTMRDFTGKWTPAQRAGLVGILNDFNGAGFQIRVFRDSVEATNGDNKIDGIRPPEAGVPASIGAVLPCFVNGKIQTGYFLRLTSNHIFKVSFASTKGPMTFAKQACTFPADLERVVKYRSQLLGLDQAGQLWILGADGKRTPFLGAPYADRRFSGVLSASRYQELLP